MFTLRHHAAVPETDFPLGRILGALTLLGVAFYAFFGALMLHSEDAGGPWILALSALAGACFLGAVAILWAVLPHRREDGY